MQLVMPDLLFVEKQGPLIQLLPISIPFMIN